MRRSTLATALVAVFISYLATPAAVKTGGYVRTDRVVNKSPLIDKNGIPTLVRFRIEIWRIQRLRS